MTATISCVGLLAADLFGGNSNWRGPIWLPINLLLIGALRRYDSALGQDFTVEYPTASGRLLTLHDIADDLSNCLIAIFLNDENGRGRSSAATSGSRPTPPGTTVCSSTSTSTVTMGPGSAPPTRPTGPGWSPI